jgi:PAS domain S-box-containing protein
MTMRASTTGRWLPSASTACGLAVLVATGCVLGSITGVLAGEGEFNVLAGGVLLAYFLVSPPRQWAAILLIGFATRAVIGLGLAGPGVSPLLFAEASAFMAVSVACVLRRLLGPAPDLSGTRNFLCFIGIGACAAAAVAAMLAAAGLAPPHRPAALPLFLTWYLTHAQGILTTAPVLLCWLRGDLEAAFPRARRLRSLALLTGFALLVFAVFGQDRLPLMFMIPPALLVLAVQLGFGGVCVAIAMLAPVSLAFTCIGEGPFALRADTPMPERLAMLQLFLFATFLYAHWIATLIAERRRHDAALQAERDELAASEQRLRESEEGFRVLASSTSDVILRLTLDLRVSTASAACLRVFGYAPEETVGFNILASIHEDDSEEVRTRLSRLAAGEAESDLIVYRVHNLRRNPMWVEANLGLLRDAAGRPACIISSVRDITERQLQAEALRTANAHLDRLAQHLTKARDRAEQANRAKSRFLAGMSHELRTPLNGILGYAQLLRIEGGLHGEQASRVDGMLSAGQHLLEMINIVLDISQIEAERVELHPAEVNTGQLARACLDLVRPAAQAKGLALETAVDPDTPGTICADPTRLRQVMLNMLGNAVKFTARGSVVLRLRPADHGAGLRVEVADTGPGIRADQRAQLFQDFERLGADAQGAVEGAGLGLALSARLAKLLGGSLGHEDNPGGGSIFWLDVPLGTDTKISEPARPAITPPPEPQLPAREAASAGLRVLVVDDVAMNREIASAFLEAAGHHPVCVEGGPQAVQAAAADDYDVVLMDVCMPEMDGCEATRLIRALGGARGGVPIVALTAQVFSEHLEECHAAGMDVHLAKPFTQEALLGSLSRAMSVAEKRHALVF